jgi:hypothetical protein
MCRKISLFVILLLAPALVASEPIERPVNFPVPPLPTPHKFWDRQNKALILAGASLRVADVITTRQMVRRGAPFDILPRAVTHSTSRLVAFSAAAAAATGGLMYLAHRKRHHRIERALGWAQAAFIGGCVGNNGYWLHRHWSSPAVY